VNIVLIICINSDAAEYWFWRVLRRAVSSSRLTPDSDDIALVSVVCVVCFAVKSLDACAAFDATFDTMLAA
jgi:hypothetical protein